MLRGREWRLAFVLAATVVGSLSTASARDKHIVTAADVKGLLHVRVEGRQILTRGSIKLPRDSRVRAGAHSSATIVWENGCRERLEAGQTRIIRDPPTCRGPAWLVKKGIIAWDFAALMAVLAREPPRRPMSR